MMLKADITGVIQDSIVEVTEENSGNLVLHLTIITECCVFKYRISDDRREPNLSIIKNDIEEVLRGSKEDNKDLCIRYDDHKSSLFVSLNDGAEKQYTAQSI